MRFKEIFIHSWKKYLICFVFGIVIILVYNTLRYFAWDSSSGALNPWVLIANYSDSCFIAAFSCLCFCGLSIVNYFGGFDIFTYPFAKKNETGARVSLYEHSQIKLEKRKKQKYFFIPYLVVSVFYFIPSAILLIVIS